MAYTVHNFKQGDVLYTEQLNEMDAQIATNEENINNSVSSDMLAENYSANKTYSIGDYVIYDNELYTCIYEITAPEGWNSTHWRIANLGDGISDLNRQLSDIEENQIPELKSAFDTTLSSDEIHTIFFQGSLSILNGSETNSDTRCRTAFVSVADAPYVIVSAKDGYKVSVRYYSEKSTASYVGYADWGTEITCLRNVYYRFVVAKTDDSTVLVADLPDDVLEIRVYHPNFEDVLSEETNIGIFNLVPYVINVTGEVIASTTRVSNLTYSKLSGLKSIIVGNGYKVALKYYSAMSDDAFISGTDWLTGTIYMETLTIPTSAVYVRFSFAYADDSTISSAMALCDKISLVYYNYVSTNNKNKIADIEDTLIETKIIPMSYKIGLIDTMGNVLPSTSRAYSRECVSVDAKCSIQINNAAKYSLRFYGDKTFDSLLGYTDWLTSNKSTTDILKMLPNGAKYIRFVIAYSDNSDIGQTYDLAQKVIVSGKEKTFVDADEFEDIAVATSNTGNFTILCAKEHTYKGGSYPVVEYYLLAEPFTNKVYISRDLKTKQYAFTFQGEIYKYCFGVLSNGDIIAVFSCNSIPWDGNAGTRSEDNRVNPFVFLAEEHWSVQHLVDFGASLKPLGWLANYGFRVLPDGSAIMCEYTRPSVLTTNTWKISGNPLNPANWVKTLSLTLSGDLESGLKHSHTVQYDFFTDICYMSTGDDNDGARLFYSLDYGDTWTEMTEAISENDRMKYLRFLNMIFTENYVYWATDWNDNRHFMFKCPRGGNGLLDFDNIIDYVAIPPVSSLSTYTTCYLPSIHAILLLERADSYGATEGPIRLVDISGENAGVIHSIGTMKSADGNVHQIGFRNVYAEVYPVNDTINVSYAFRKEEFVNGNNQNAWFDNYIQWEGDGLRSINNLYLKVYMNDDGYGLTLGTRYI